MMMYELVRPICRASLQKEGLDVRANQKLTLRTQAMTADLKKLEQTAKTVLAQIPCQQTAAAPPQLSAMSDPFRQDYP